MKNMFNKLVSPMTTFFQGRKNRELGDAIEVNHSTNVQVAISKGAKVSDTFVSSKCTTSKNNNDFLMEALERGCSFSVLLTLMSCDGNVKALNFKGDNVLGIAIDKNVDSNIGPNGLIRELIKIGADVNHVREYKINNKDVKLSLLDRVNAIYEDAIKTVDIIDAAIRDIDSSDKKGDIRGYDCDGDVKIGDYQKYVLVKYNSNLISIELIKNGAKTAEELLEDRRKESLPWSRQFN